MLKVKGKFVAGINGSVDFEVAALSAGGAMDALEEALAEYGDNVSTMRVRPFEYAHMVYVQGELLTREQILELTTQDYDLLNHVAGELAKKLESPVLAAARAAAIEVKSPPKGNSSN